MSADGIGTTIAALLGQQSSLLEGLAREFRGDNSSATSVDYVTWTFVATAVLVGLWWLAKRQDPARPRIVNSPKRLFRELCDAHDLPRSERRRLAALAERRGMDNPALLFVEPSSFDVAADFDEGDAETDRLRMLRDWLFGDEPATIANEAGRTS